MQIDRKSTKNYLTLFLFGVLFNRLVQQLGRKYGDHGYTAWLVVIGVGFTIIGVLPQIGLRNGLQLLLAFVASGSPMIAGDVLRHLRDESDIARLMEEIAGDGRLRA